MVPSAPRMSPVCSRSSTAVRVVVVMAIPPSPRWGIRRHAEPPSRRRDAQAEMREPCCGRVTACRTETNTADGRHVDGPVCYPCRLPPAVAHAGADEHAGEGEPAGIRRAPLLVRALARYDVAPLRAQPLRVTP